MLSPLPFLGAAALILKDQWKFQRLLLLFTTLHSFTFRSISFTPPPRLLFPFFYSPLLRFSVFYLFFNRDVLQLLAISGCRAIGVRLFSLDDPARLVMFFFGEGVTYDGKVLFLGVFQEDTVDEAPIFMLIFQQFGITPQSLLQGQLHLSTNTSEGGWGDGVGRGPDDVIGSGVHLAGGGGVHRVKIMRQS